MRDNVGADTQVCPYDTVSRGRHAGLPLRSKWLNYYGAW
jgi:hypothetical protein